METSMMVYDYPEPTEPKEHTLKLKMYVETVVTVYGDDEENWKEQINEMKESEIFEYINDYELEEYEKID